MYEYSLTSTTSYGTMTTFIGRNSGSVTTFHGLIEMLSYKNAYCEISTLNTLRTALNIISTKSSVDEFQRITSKEIHKSGVNILSNTYEYKMASTNPNCTSYQVGVEVIKGGSATLATRTYTYDQMQRLTNINDPVFGSKTYVYNDRGFLTYDGNTNYIYYGNGNIRAIDSLEYTYDSTVKDKLISVGTKSITYDSTKPLFVKTYDGKTFTYTNDLLTRVAYSGGYTSYEYNSDGLRINKKDYRSVVLSYYYYDGNRLVTEITGSNRLDFLYDEQGLLFGLILNNTNKYFYVRDAFQNILGLVDENGTLVVKYSYNAYGLLLNTVDTSGVSIGTLNPFRYKGYYYDSESRLYNINSLYYSPDLCRFIQPVGLSTLNPHSINGLNLYAYANNNPISIAYSSSGVVGGMVNSIASSVGGLNSRYHGTISNSSNIFSAFGALSIAFEFFDQWSGYIAGGLDAGFKVANKIGTSGANISSYIKGLEVFGIAMIVTGSIISFGESVYNSYNNPYYTSNEVGLATLMDFGYYTLKGVGTYALGSALGNLAVGVGLAVGGIAGGALAVFIGITAAVTTYVLWEGMDYLYGKIKEWIFE